MFLVSMSIFATSLFILDSHNFFHSFFFYTKANALKSSQQKLPTLKMNAVFYLNADFKKQFLLLFARGKYHYFVKNSRFSDYCFLGFSAYRITPQNIFPGKRENHNNKV